MDERAKRIGLHLALRRIAHARLSLSTNATISALRLCVATAILAIVELFERCVPYAAMRPAFRTLGVDQTPSAATDTDRHGLLVCCSYPSGRFWTLTGFALACLESREANEIDDRGAGVVRAVCVARDVCERALEGFKFVQTNRQRDAHLVNRKNSCVK